MSVKDGFREDIIIANDDGYLYHITQRDLREGKNARGESFKVDPNDKHFKIKYGDVVDMLSHGMVVGAVPKVEDEDRADVTILPIICYVLNVDALKHYNCWEPWHTRKMRGASAPPRSAATGGAATGGAATGGAATGGAATGGTEAEAGAEG